MLKNTLTAFIMFFLLSSCTQVVNPTQPSEVPSITQTHSESPTIPTATSTLAPTVTPTLEPTPTPTPTEHPGWLPEGALMRTGKGTLFSLAASPDGSLVAIAAKGGIYMIDPLTGRVLDFLETIYNPLDVTFSPDGNRVFIGLGIGGTQIWNPGANGTWQIEKTLPAACGSFIKVSPDGNILLAKCASKRSSALTGWNLAKEMQIFSLTLSNNNDVFVMDFSPSDPTKAVYTRGNAIVLLDVRTGKDIKSLSISKAKMITDLDYSPDGKTIAVSPNTKEVILVDAESLKEINRYPHDSEVRMLSFMDDKTYITLDAESYVIEKLDGTKVKQNHFNGFPLHAYLPKHNILVLSSDKIEFVSLNTNKTLSQISGFSSINWMPSRLTGKKDVFLYATGSYIDPGFDKASQRYYSASFLEPDKFDHFDIMKFCPDIKSVYFIDSRGLYLGIDCWTDRKIHVIEKESMNEIYRYEYSDDHVLNAYHDSESGEEDKELSAMLYRLPETDMKKYRVEIWEPIQHQMVSEFIIEEALTKKPTYPPTLVRFSPSSKYLVILAADRWEFLIVDTTNGKIVQKIKVSLPDTQPYDYPYSTLINNETMLMIRKGKTVEIVSIETGEPVIKYFNLKTTNPVYIEDVSRLVTYTYREVNPGTMMLYLDYYTLDSDKVEESISLTIPTVGNLESEASSIAYSCEIEHDSNIYLLPNSKGKKAAAYIICSSINKSIDFKNPDLYKAVIAMIDIENREVKKLHAYYPSIYPPNKLWYDTGGFYSDRNIVGNLEGIYKAYYDGASFFDEKLFTINENFAFIWDISMK